MYALNLLKIALELAQYNPVYEDIASKFFEHFLSIANAMNVARRPTDKPRSGTRRTACSYDRIHLPRRRRRLPLRKSTRWSA